VPSRLEEIAGRFVDDLVTVQPDGPYYLGGYSFGGRLAFEMARRLEAMGRRVAFLGLIDTYGPGYPAHLPPMRRIWSHLRAATHPDPRERRRYIRERLLRVGGRVRGLTRKLLASPWADRLLVPDYIRDDYHYHRWLSQQYAPAPYAGRLTLFRAIEVPERIGTDFSDPYLGWGRLAAGGVDVRPVPGDHLSLLARPHVGSLARSLRDTLARSPA
jgi:thioesterase domain-containing protein